MNVPPFSPHLEVEQFISHTSPHTQHTKEIYELLNCIYPRPFDKSPLLVPAEEEKKRRKKNKAFFFLGAHNVLTVSPLSSPFSKFIDTPPFFFVFKEQYFHKKRQRGGVVFFFWGVFFAFLPTRQFFSPSYFFRCVWHIHLTIFFWGVFFFYSKQKSITKHFLPPSPPPSLPYLKAPSQKKKKKDIYVFLNNLSPSLSPLPPLSTPILRLVTPFF